MNTQLRFGICYQGVAHVARDGCPFKPLLLSTAAALDHDIQTLRRYIEISRRPPFDRPELAHVAFPPIEIDAACDGSRPARAKEEMSIANKESSFSAQASSHRGSDGSRICVAEVNEKRRDYAIQKIRLHDTQKVKGG